jgi:hypothetical protein
MNTDLKGTVKCPSSYFKKMAMVDYSNWKNALAREFFQNSIDAGSKRIDVNFDNNNSLITIKDNGCGMSLDVILNKLLVLGASHKAEGSVGAFGKAKELLYFSWPSWSVETKGLLISGQGPEYTITKTSSKIKGVTSIIHVDEDSISSIRDCFLWVAGHMDTKSKIFIDGCEIKPTHSKGQHVRTLDFGKLYWNKSYKSSYLSYKINGIWMFDSYLGDTKGSFTFDLEKSSLELLTSNRDDIQWKYRSTLQSLVNSMVTEKESFTKTKFALVKEYIYGTKPNIPVENASLNLANSVVSTGPQGAPQHQPTPSSEISRKNSLGVKVKGYDKDFAVIYTTKNKTDAKYFLRQKRAGLILKIWENIIHQVLKDNSLGETFIPGLTFDPTVEASMIGTDGKYEFYVNPYKIGKAGGWNNKMTSNRFFLTEDLKDKAIHEVAHCFTPCHDESFVATMHSLRGNTLKSHKIYNKIGRIK